MKYENASCFCGNISVKLKLSSSIDEYIPRSCDCDFCAKYAASYISDPKGCLNITITSSKHAIYYKQGSGIADFLVCGKCGVLVLVSYYHNSELIGAINSRTLENYNSLKPAQTVSPKLLTDDEKINRWMSVWFRDVSIKTRDK